MKRTAIFFFLLGALSLSAQNASTVETRALIQNFRQAKSVDKMSKELMNRFVIRQSNDGQYIGVTAKVGPAFDKELLSRDGIVVTSQVADIVAMRVPIERLESLQSAPGIVSFSVAHRAQPTMDNTRADTRTDSVQAGLGVPMPFNGEGVLIGITDWGFDYTHPNLTKKANPRIERAWDQYKTSGPAPAGFDYGTEHVGYDALKAAKCDTSNLYKYNTHGTHVAGICGGSGLANGHVVGQAPGVHFLLGSWFLDETSWLDQVAWMYKASKEANKRLVINSSWGMYTFSTLDGTSHLSQAINAYADSGIVFVTSGGNNGDCNFHIRHTFTDNDTLRSVASYYSSGIGQALIFWGEPTNQSNSGNFKVGFEFVSSDTVFRSPLYSTSDNINFLEGDIMTDSIAYHYDIMTESSNPLNQRPHILMNVSKARNYSLRIICIADEGTMVNVWNVANLANNAGNMGNDFVTGNFAGCVAGDKWYGIGEPACADKTISVAAHEADQVIAGQFQVGSLAYFSSNGPTLDGRYKPEISAPGVNVVSSISSYCDGIDDYHAYQQVVSGGHHYIWSKMSGTSMSSPAVSGIVALMLQANPRLTVDEIKEIIFTTARNDKRTGPLHQNDSISLQWGYGKIDALRAVNMAYDRLSIEDRGTIQPQLVAFPNPTRDRLTVLTGTDRMSTAELYSIDGTQVMSFNVSSEATVDISHLNKGVYLLRVKETSGVRTIKIVKD